MNIQGSLFSFALLTGLWCAQAADLTLRVSDQEPPKEAGEGIKKTLQSKAIEVLDGSTVVYQFWFRTETPLKAPPESAAKALQSLDEITLLGLARVGEGRRDYKDNEIVPGVYTMRFSLQPKDGDHLGTSEFPFFAVLVPAKSDAQPDSIKTYKAMVKASGKGTATGHPIVLALRPPSAQTSDTPGLTTPAPDHKAVRVKIPARASGSSEEISLTFELVVVGKFKS